MFDELKWRYEILLDMYRGKEVTMKKELEEYKNAHPLLPVPADDPNVGKMIRAKNSAIRGQYTRRENKIRAMWDEFYTRLGNVVSTVYLLPKDVATLVVEKARSDDLDEYDEPGKINEFAEFANEIVNAIEWFLNTLANKSDIDMSDSGWRAIFDAVASQVSLMESNPFSIEDYAKEFAKKLAFDTGNEVELQFPLYANRTRIDVLEHLGEGQCRIYDFMSTKANLKSLEELRTHWDGMVSQGQQPISAVMYCPSRGPMLPHSCEEFNNRIQAMDDTDYAKAIKAADGDVSKMPHYNFDVILDPNIPANK